MKSRREPPHYVGALGACGRCEFAPLCGLRARRRVVAESDARAVLEYRPALGQVCEPRGAVGAPRQAPVLDHRQRQRRHGEPRKAARRDEHQQVDVRQRLRRQVVRDLCASAGVSLAHFGPAFVPEYLLFTWQKRPMHQRT